MLRDEDAGVNTPVLVVVVNDPADLARARDLGWYRIPLDRAPQRIAADHLAFYQTGAFPPGEQWLIRWQAPVRSYQIVRRRDLLPTNRRIPVRTTATIGSNWAHWKPSPTPFRASGCAESPSSPPPRHDC